jgi:bifunctional DNA-binding transcriptional regulator/antitoxin component of YhaV-PrlF toxin-antitoxin module
MAQTRRKLEERNIRKITKVAGGSSFAITLPIEMARKLGWREKQKVVVKQRGKKLTVEDWPVRQAQDKDRSKK